MSEASPNRGRFGSKIGPPPDDLFAKQSDVPAVDALLAQSVKSLVELPALRAGQRRFQGQMNFDHVALVGPPTRLQGGLHGPGRTYTILDAIAHHNHATTFPSGYSVRIGSGIQLFKPVSFTAEYQSSAAGWQLATKFEDSDKLAGLAFSLAPTHPVFSPDILNSWRGRYEAAKPSAGESIRILSIPHFATPELFWAEFDFQQLFGAAPGLRRFTQDGESVGLSFMTFYLDNVAILSQATLLQNPMFTIQIGIAFRTGQIPSRQKLLILADRRNVASPPFPTAKPVLVRGREEHSRIVNVILTDADFTTIYAHGWATGHPMNIELMWKKAAAP